jgi:hypothetical protein
MTISMKISSTGALVLLAGLAGFGTAGDQDLAQLQGK